MKEALIIVDPQNDFFNHIPNATQIIDPLNKVVNSAKKNNWLVTVSRDWHSKDCFDHCIKNTDGANFHHDLNIDKNTPIISKGEFELSDKNYSAFNGDNISLEKFLKQNNIDEVFIAGLATDYCVKQTAIDSVKKGFKTYIIWDASKGIFKNKSEEEIRKEIIENGIGIIESKDL